MRQTLTVLALLVAAVPAFAQSRSFTLGKWVEIQNSILKELNRSYVDTLPLNRIERLGIDAMLEGLDPYTVYVPEEEQENFQMMASVPSSISRTSMAMSLSMSPMPDLRPSAAGSSAEMKSSRSTASPPMA